MPPVTVEVARVRIDPSSTTSKLEGWQRASGLAQEFCEHPERFDEFRARECCRAPERWSVGRDIGLTSAVLALRPGQTLCTPIQDYTSYVIPRLVDAESPPPAAPVAMDFSRP